MKQFPSFTLSAVCIILLLTTSGCMKMLFGMKSAKNADNKTIISLEQKWNIPVADGYEMDSSYNAFLHVKRDSSSRLLVAHHYQPLQVLYFEKGNLYPIRYYINCDFPTKISGIGLNQNYSDSGRFDRFLPLPLTPVDTLLSLTKQLSFLQPLSAGERYDIGGYDYLVFVYWSRFMGRQSRHFIKTIQNNVALAKDKSVKLIYVNNDRFLKSL